MPVVVEPVLAGIAPASSTAELWDEECDEAKIYLNELLSRSELEGIPVKTEIAQDYPAPAIVEYARDPNVVLIAMATHGRTGLSRWVLGSVAQKVLHSAPKPLLLVRPGKNHLAYVKSPFLAELTYDTILVPLDGSRFAEQALDQARKLAWRSDATIVLVSALPDGNETELEEHRSSRWTVRALRAGVDRASCYLMGVAEKLRQEGMKVQTKVVQGTPAESILEVSEKEHADLIVMATHGRSGLQTLWLGSVAMKVTQSSTIPVLLVRAHETNGHK